LNRQKIYVFTKYSKKFGSSRVRFYNYEKFISDNYDLIFYPLFTNSFLDKKKKKSLIYFICRYCVRLFFAFKITISYNKQTVWLENEFLPYIPFFIENIFYKLNKVISNYDDAIFHNYDMNKSSFVRSILVNKIDKVMKHSLAVIVGNDYLASRAFKNNNNVHVIPSVLNLNDYPKILRHKKNTITVGWIGSPSTTVNLNMVEKVLYDLKKKYNINILLIGSSIQKESLLYEISDIVDWSESTEVESLRKIDVGIMPLEDKDFNKGKCSFKLIQYMGVSSASVCSPIGMNKQVVKNDYNGYWAYTEQDWYNYLEKLIVNHSLRLKMGNRGYDMFVEKYTYQATSKSIIEILKVDK